MPSRDSHLVCQHLENIGRDVLQEYPEVVRSLAQGQHGVYALYRGDRLCHVGLATNVSRRLDQHLRDRHRGTGNRFSLYLTVDDRHLREIEVLFLRLGKPPGNRTRPGPGSENLRSELSRRITQQQRQQRIRTMGTSARRRKWSVRRRGTDRRPAALAPYVTERMEIRLVHQGRTRRATLRKNGTIFYREGSHRWLWGSW